MKLMGILFILIGILIIVNGSISVGYAMIEINGIKKYIVAIPQIIFGLYILIQNKNGVNKN